MKRNTKKTETYFLVILVLILVATSSALFFQNRKFQQANRELIIQNDSIMSANIELTNELLVNKSSVNR